MRASTLASLALLVATPLAARQSPQAGPLIHSAGAVYPVEAPDFPTPHGQVYRVAFEIARAAPEAGRMNVALNTVARFMNMHAQAGVPPENLRPAIVVHGPASFELMDDESYRERTGTSNPNARILEELQAAGVKVILCGQSAASRGIARDQLVDGVELALSAMTAFAVLEEQGYSANPW